MTTPAASLDATSAPPTKSAALWEDLIDVFTGPTAVFARRAGDQIVYVDVIESAHKVRYAAQAGETFPIHCSASGKLLLAYKPAAERVQLIEAMPLTRFTERTICDRQLLTAELDRIAVNGYALDNEEYVLGVACVAVAVRTAEGEVVAAVAVHAATAETSCLPAGKQARDDIAV